MKRLSENETATLILLGVFIFGSWLRLMPPAIAGFPLNDGGMFYSMIRDLRLNGYSLPAFTTYNNLNIPFTYPPLAFYLAGWLSDFFHLTVQTVLLWLPAFINILTLPAFALLANSMLQSRIKAATATMFYALTPLSMDWFLMGGGLTRGIGQLFLILICWCAYNLFSSHSRKFLLATIVCGAILVLTHPESALLAFTSVAIIWVFSSRSLSTIFDALLVGLGICIICAPWLFYVLQLHGISPFINALQTNGNSRYLWTALFSFDFAQESGLALMATFGLVALFVKLGEKDYLFPVWVAIPFFINPRSSARATIIPLAFLAAISLLDIILPAITGKAEKKTGASSFSSGIFLAFICIYMLFNAFLLDNKMANNKLSDNDQKVMSWINQNTPSNSKFIILTGESLLMRDPVQEWFPALTGRNSQTTLQGLEWIWGEKFIASIGTYQGLQTCLLQDLACLDEQTHRLGLIYDYVYIKKEPVQACEESDSCHYSQSLINGLRNDGGFNLIYEDNTTAIFKKLN